MPSPKSQRRHIRRRDRNRPQRTLARSRVGLTAAAIATEPAAPETMETVKAAVAALDRAVAKGIIHRNAASRRKSRLTKSLSKASKAAAS